MCNDASFAFLKSNVFSKNISAAAIAIVLNLLQHIATYNIHNTMAKKLDCHEKSFKANDITSHSHFLIIIMWLK